MDRARTRRPRPGERQQLDLPFRRPTLPCAFGETGEGWDGPHHCAACNAEVERAVAYMAAAVARGEYNERGYTPAEWKAHVKRGGE